MVPRLRTRLLVGTAWNLLAAIFSQGSTFASNVFVARMLGREVFGEYAMVQSTLLTTAGIVQLAIGYTATKYVAELRSVDRDKTGRILGLCSVLSLGMACLGALVVTVASPLLASNVLAAPHLATPLMIGVGVILFAAVNGYQIGVLAGLERYRTLAQAGILSGLGVLAAVFAGAHFWGLEGAVLGLSSAALLRWLIHMLCLRRALREAGLKVMLRGSLHERDLVMRFAVPAALSGFTALAALWIANSTLVRRTDGYLEMALYTAGFNLMTLVLFVPTTLNGVVTSMINQQRGVQSRSGYSKLYRGNLIITGSICIAAASFMAFVGPYALHVFGKEFTVGAPVLYLLLGAAFFEAMTIAYHQALQSHARMWPVFLGVAIPRDGGTIVLAYLLTPGYGAVGLAMAYGAGRLVGFVCIAVLARATIRAAAIFATSASP